ncbi:hypothetical protein BT69DRAFT_1306283 [Atractiella rhizophila]|nr:hypothetical protein BT69DRAFT_1306283 [Atractiella rhizophila]
MNLYLPFHTPSSSPASEILSTRVLGAASLLLSVPLLSLCASSSPHPPLDGLEQDRALTEEERELDEIPQLEVVAGGGGVDDEEVLESDSDSEEDNEREQNLDWRPKLVKLTYIPGGVKYFSDGSLVLEDVEPEGDDADEMLSRNP